MPIYTYKCTDCGQEDQRIGGVDDHCALCLECGGIMLRLDADVWAPLWAEHKNWGIIYLTPENNNESSL